MSLKITNEGDSRYKINCSWYLLMAQNDVTIKRKDDSGEW